MIQIKIQNEETMLCPRCKKVITEDQEKMQVRKPGEGMFWYHSACRRGPEDTIEFRNDYFDRWG